MKFLAGLCLLLLVSILGMGQDKPMSTDDRGKLIYYEVVVAKDIAKDSLTMRASDFLNRSAKFMTIRSIDTDTLMHATGKMIINKTALVLSRPSGDVHYNFYVETREGKYRFWMTDFKFVPYQRNRYGNFVPTTSKGIPLEHQPGKLNSAEWAGYVKAVTREANVLSTRFKQSMVNKILPVIKEKPVIPTQEW